MPSILQNDCLVGISNLESAILSLPNPLKSPLAWEKGTTDWRKFQVVVQDVAPDAHPGAFITTKCTSWSGLLNDYSQATAAK